jgi:hypothetical protein
VEHFFLAFDLNFSSSFQFLHAISFSLLSESHILVSAKYLSLHAITFSLLESNKGATCHIWQYFIWLKPRADHKLRQAHSNPNNLDLNGSGL